MNDDDYLRAGIRTLRGDIREVREEQFSPFIYAASSEMRQMIWRRLQLRPDSREAQMYFRAAQLAQQLLTKYKVKVQVVPNDAKYYSDVMIATSVRDNMYFVSAENPEETAKITEMLIRFGVEKDRHLVEEAQERKLELLEIANEKRTEKSVQTAQKTAPIIATIVQKYKDENKGKDPSLHKLADLLNESGTEAPSGPGSKWYAQSVKRVMDAGKTVQKQ